MMGQCKRWLMALAACLLLWPALVHADGPECAGERCSRGRFLDHFPYVWYLRMHWGHQEAPESYVSACYHITPSYRIFQPYCWYVNPAQLYPAGPPPVEPTIQTTAATPTAMPAAAPAPAPAPSTEALPPPRPLPER